jgi:hypothetical protein
VIPILLDSSGHYQHSSIVLQTRAGNPIDNLQAWEYSRFEWNLLGGDLARFKNAEKVAEACPVYNCHGLTFGSRRTHVTTSIYPILDDDGFDHLPSEKDARAGDIIVYCNARGEVIHSGFVVGKKPALVAGTEVHIPIVWSKWGKGYEMVHTVAECPYLEEEGNYPRYYRLKRWVPAPSQPAPQAIITL